MTETQYERASQIQIEMEGIKSEMELWARAGDKNVLRPLTFRMGGGLNHTPPQAFTDFRSACHAGMIKKLYELQLEFGLL